MYRTDLNNKDKSGAIAAVVAIHAGLAFMLLQLSSQIDIRDLQQPLRVFEINDVIDPPPPPPPPPPKQMQQQPKPKKPEGGSAPNIKSEATPIVAPTPRIVIESPVAVSETPRQGTAPTQGLAPVAGLGTGSGGSGTGTGTGSGAGPGGGGDGGVAERARLMSPSLRSRDFPGAYRRLLSSGRAPFVMYTVLPNGRVTNCRVYESSGEPVLDNITCSLVTSRFVYRPAYNRRGEPVESQMAYRQAE
jgi:protein TonB